LKSQEDPFTCQSHYLDTFNGANLICVLCCLKVS